MQNDDVSPERLLECLADWEVGDDKWVESVSSIVRSAYQVDMLTAFGELASSNVPHAHVAGNVLLWVLSELSGELDPSVLGMCKQYETGYQQRLEGVNATWFASVSQINVTDPPVIPSDYQPTNYFETLPPEVKERVLDFVPPRDLGSAGKVTGLEETASNYLQRLDNWGKQEAANLQEQQDQIHREWLLSPDRQAVAEYERSRTKLLAKIQHVKASLAHATQEPVTGSASRKGFHPGRLVKTLVPGGNKTAPPLTAVVRHKTLEAIGRLEGVLVGLTLAQRSRDRRLDLQGHYEERKPGNVGQQLADQFFAGMNSLEAALNGGSPHLSKAAREWRAQFMGLMDQLTQLQTLYYVYRNNAQLEGEQLRALVNRRQPPG